LQRQHGEYNFIYYCLWSVLRPNGHRACEGNSIFLHTILCRILREISEIVKRLFFRTNLSTFRWTTSSVMIDFRPWPLHITHILCASVFKFSTPIKYHHSSLYSCILQHIADDKFELSHLLRLAKKRITLRTSRLTYSER